VLAAQLAVPAAERLQSVIGAFCKSAAMPVTTFGRFAFGDPRFVLDLQLGRTPRPAALLQVAAFISLWGERRWDEEPRSRGRRLAYRLRRHGDLFILESREGGI
jgi:hypothetical protein